MQPEFSAIKQRPISRQVSEVLRASIVNGELPPDENLYADPHEVATEHLPLIDAMGRRDIAVVVNLVQVPVLDAVEPLQTRLLLQRESAG